MLTIAILISQLFDRVTQAIQTAQNAGLVLEVNAGGQVQNLINQAKETYSDMLDKTVSSLSAQEQQCIASLQAIVQDLEHNVIDDIASKIQTIANTLPLSDKFPQVAAYSGNIVSPNTNTSFTFQLTGNFPHIAEHGADAIVKFSGKSINNIIKTTQSISFQINKSDFQFPANTITYMPFTVDIPYIVKILGLIPQKKIATYNFVFIVLPPSPGSIVLQTTKKVSVRHEADGVCSNLIWDSSDDDIDNIQGCNMEDGWQCMRETVHYAFTRHEGDPQDLGNASTPSFAGWHFKTEHHGLGTSGKITVNLYYRKWKDIMEDQTTAVNAPINWGDEKALAIDPEATWKIIYQQFDGVTKEYISSETDNPYIKITEAGSQLSVKVIP